MKKKYIILSRENINFCKVAILSISFYLLPVANTDANNYTVWTEQVNVESKHVELIEHASSDFKIELMQNIVGIPDKVANHTISNLKVDSPHQEIFNIIKQNLSYLPIEEANVTYMHSDPGFFFTLKLKDNVEMNMASYIDGEDDDAYVNIWKNGLLVVQDYMPITDLTKILLSYYGERS